MGKNPAMKKILVILLLVINAESKSQDKHIAGSVYNSVKQPIQGVSVTLRSNDSSKIIAFAITGRDGSFRVGPVAVSVQGLVLEFRHVGYDQKKIALTVAERQLQEFLRIELAEKAIELKEIVIKRELPVLIRSDTVVFNANSYRDPDVRKVEDLLKKMQGFSVDATGKLSFNGKPVERVLIDGDDLAADVYQMITKNLSAITIDKVEVINNFSDNRLLRKVVDSDKVGVNLKISSRFKSKLSGSAEGGLAWEGRYNADANAIYITSGSKWLTFGSYNNIARDVSGNARYYYQEQGGQLDPEDRAPAGASVLEEGSFIMPPIGDRYTRDNKDLGMAAMNSWKIGKHTRINGMIAYDNLRQGNYASNSVFTNISDQEQWSILSQLNLNRSSTDMIGRFSFHHDPGKQQLSRIDLVVNTGKQHNSFFNNSTGEITDSLREKIDNRLIGLRFKGQHSLLMKDKVMQIEFLIDHGKLDQDLDINSSRYLAYWQLDSSYILNRQLLGKMNSSGQLRCKLNGKTSSLQYEYGLLSEYSATNLDSEAKIHSINVKPAFEPGRQVRAIKNASVRGTFNLLFNADRSGWFAFGGNSGLQSFKAGNKCTLMVYETSLGYTKKFGLMNSFRLNYKLSRGFKKFDQLFPDQLMSGNATILNGIDFSEPELTQGFVMFVNGNNIGKQRTWSANASFIRTPGRYINSADVFPQYLVQYFELTNISHMFNLGANGEFFVRNLKSKLGILFNVYSGRNENTVNDVKGISARNGFKLETWWVSGFRIPINLEVRLGSNYSEGNWNEGPLNTVWQYYWSNKLKIRYGPAFYGSVLWTGQRLPQQKAFHGLDIFATYKLNQSMNLSLSGVNLMNFRRMVDVAAMPYSRSENAYLLVGRYLLVSLSLSF
jgi:hypothetical protein